MIDVAHASDAGWEFASSALGWDVAYDATPAIAQHEIDAASLTVDVFDDITSPALWAEWDALEATGHLTVFQSRFFMEHFLGRIPQEHGARPYVVVVRDRAGQPQVLIPFVWRRRGAMRMLELADLDLCDYCAPILGPAARFDARQAAIMWKKVVAALPAADGLSMKKMPRTVGPLDNPLALLPDSIMMGVSTSVVPIRDIDLTRTSAHRDAAGKIRKMKKEGDYVFRRVTDPDEVARAVNIMITQRHHRCRELGQTSNLDNPNIGAFFRDLAVAGAASGRTSMTTIDFDGATIATFLGFTYRGRFNGIITTMGGNQYRRYSPGLCNMVSTQDLCKEEGLEVFDIGVGAHAYKARFGGTPLDLFEYHTPLTLRGHLPAIKRRLVRDARIYFDKYPGLNRKVRRLLRK
ncbi:Protein involved in cellulose biosynthesis (CelD) [Hartmannibacter diazotrophicus]|uniref:Protein involved in cellulose biosynthesis (CelD) n=1 Tax=Hartmannibacter diazotrophicus TaxID=1482074 RepID=A0A2C9D3A3_9HYPH|nr:GNAT family N-acetyltransferase [Hartmannibacter diazotrophicus]SON54807.1 Protein involved in cellulose biosynthesis (CelD) [Hartmannibacter diazotrophicus]